MNDQYMPCHQYQRDMVISCGGGDSSVAILNTASKEDPAHLGRDFGAVNLDIEDFDIETRTNLYTVPNFVQGTATHLPFEDNSFDIVVLGELLEHCNEDAALRVLQETSRVLKKDGAVVVTFPQDTRLKHVQRPPRELREYEEGITSWHQTVWQIGTLNPILDQADLRIVREERIRYAVCDYAGVECWGMGLVLEVKE